MFSIKYEYKCFKHKIHLQVGLWDLELLCHPVDWTQHKLSQFQHLLLLVTL